MRACRRSVPSLGLRNTRFLGRVGTELPLPLETAAEPSRGPGVPLGTVVRKDVDSSTSPGLSSARLWLNLSGPAAARGPEPGWPRPAGFTSEEPVTRGLNPAPTFLRNSPPLSEPAATPSRRGTSWPTRSPTAPLASESPGSGREEWARNRRRCDPPRSGACSPSPQGHTCHTGKAGSSGI